MITRSWKVFGAPGHRQKKSFFPSQRIDASVLDDIRIIEILNADRTGSNDFSIIRITRNNAHECTAEFAMQLVGGAFEGCRTGETEEITENELLRIERKAQLLKFKAYATKRFTEILEQEVINNAV